MKARGPKAVAVAFLLWLAWVPMHAQNGDALAKLDRAFEAAMAAHRSDCVLKPERSVESRHRVDDTTSTPFHHREWRRGGSRVEITYSVEASPDVAREVVARELKIAELGSAPIEGFADEAYFTRQYTPEGGSRLFFRRGAVLVSVYAPAPPELATEIGSLLLAEIDKEFGPKGR